MWNINHLVFGARNQTRDRPNLWVLTFLLDHVSHPQILRKFEVDKWAKLRCVSTDLCRAICLNGHILNSQKLLKMSSRPDNVIAFAGNKIFPKCDEIFVLEIRLQRIEVKIHQKLSSSVHCPTYKLSTFDTIAHRKTLCTLSMELFSRRRWTNGLAQKSNKYGIHVLQIFIWFVINTTVYLLADTAFISFY